MKTEQCPECGSELEIREVAPCAECGMLADKLAVLRQDIHEGFAHDSIEYNVYSVLDKFRITLCDSCAVDIGSYESDYFGLPRDKRLDYCDLHIVKMLAKPGVGKDKYCPKCNRRLTFIKFALNVRAENTT